MMTAVLSRVAIFLSGNYVWNARWLTFFDRQYCLIDDTYCK